MLLKRGDCVSIIAPAAQLRSADRELAPRAVALLESWGLIVKLRMADKHYFYLAGSDAVRAKYLADAFADSETKVVFCARGGYGSPRLLASLAALPGPSTEKTLVGYSDATALHAAVGRLWPQVHLIHGPNLITSQLLGDNADGQTNRHALHSALFSSEGIEGEQVEFLLAGQACGPLVGGCMSLLTAMLGTPFAPDTSGAVLFLEDTGEPPYRIDRMISQMRLAGLFENVAGVVFGVMRNCTDPYNDLRDILRDLFADSPFPVAYGLRSGHGDVNLSLRLGWSATLNSKAGRFSLQSVSCVAV